MTPCWKPADNLPASVSRREEARKAEKKAKHEKPYSCDGYHSIWNGLWPACEMKASSNGLSIHQLEKKAVSQWAKYREKKEKYKWNSERENSERNERGRKADTEEEKKCFNHEVCLSSLWYENEMKRRQKRKSLKRNAFLNTALSQWKLKYPELEIEEEASSHGRRKYWRETVKEKREGEERRNEMLCGKWRTRNDEEEENRGENINVACHVENNKYLCKISKSL